MTAVMVEWRKSMATSRVHKRSARSGARDEENRRSGENIAVKAVPGQSGCP